jgi:pyruvate/2-oxoglutarate dehydrogenase complex dihydrolipoamide dehydrogenase (E3) component
MQRDVSLVLPNDEFNRVLVDNVRPPGWSNPDPAGRYNLVVIGAGTAGLVTAAIAAAVGAKVALIERHLMGGDCLNVGCVPSKGVIAAARRWTAIRGSAEFGVKGIDPLNGDFAAAMERMRRLRARISPNDSARRFSGLGVDVFIGEARFVGPGAIEIGGKRLAYAKAAICTGARAAIPALPGLEQAGYLTNETLFTLTELPRRLAVIGAGPIGCEMAQAFTRFGSEVSVFERVARVLPQDDADAAAIVHGRMVSEGVTFFMNSEITRFERRGAEKVVHFEVEGAAREQVVDEILVSVGRTPNVEGLGLESVGVLYDSRSGVKVSDRLQTTNPSVYAAGDVCFPLKFTHAADANAQIVIQNALFPHPLGLGWASTRSLVIPWVTYTDPEVAHVGMSEAEALAVGIAVDTFTVKVDEVDRAILDGEDEGFARVHVKKGTDKILGATIVAAHAGDLISEFTLAMRNGLGLSAIAGTIHPYPTQAELARKVAYLWRKSTFTDGKRKILKRWFEWTR